jgi:hypothetical protein
VAVLQASSSWVRRDFARILAEPREAGIMRERWPELLQRDPYYNPNLSRARADFSLGN